MNLIKNSLFLGTINSYVVDSPTSSNISYIFNVGSMIGLVIVTQIITGIILSLFYIPQIDLAFSSIEHVHRDVAYGSIVRYMHSNGAAILFILIYIHIGKAIYFTSYKSPRTLLFYNGIVIFLALMAIAFIGYTLPFGTMSYWGATVITSMFGLIPLIGDEVLHILWGNFYISNATLTRLYSLHYLLPFILIILIIVHIVLLRQSGSSNSLSINTSIDKINFNPYFTFKDIIGFIWILVAYIIIVGYFPNVFSHPDNYIAASPSKTPLSIVPEFYFLPFYAILRVIPSKSLGLIAMIASILILFLMPFIDRTNINGYTFKPLFKISFFIFLINFIFLASMGAMHINPFISGINMASTLVYFGFFGSIFIFSMFHNLLPLV